MKINPTALSITVLSSLFALSGAQAVCPTLGEGGIDYASIAPIISDANRPDVPRGKIWRYHEDEETGEAVWLPGNSPTEPTYMGNAALDIRSLGLCLHDDDLGDTRMYMNLRLGAFPMAYRYPDESAEDGFSWQLLGTGDYPDAGLPEPFQGVMVFSFADADLLGDAGGAPVYHFVVHFNAAEGETLDSLYANGERFPSGFYIYQAASKITNSKAFHALKFNPASDTRLASTDDIEPQNGPQELGPQDGQGLPQGPGWPQESGNAGEPMPQDPGPSGYEDMMPGVDADGKVMQKAMYIEQNLGPFSRFTGINASSNVLVKVETYKGSWNPENDQIAGIKGLKGTAANKASKPKRLDNVKQVAKGVLGDVIVAAKPSRHN